MLRDIALYKLLLPLTPTLSLYVAMTPPVHAVHLITQNSVKHLPSADPTRIQ